MSYNGEGVQALVCALEELNSSNILNSDSKIKRILSCLAYYEEFRTALVYCSKGFDYKEEKSVALTIAEDGKPFLRLPRAPKNIVAFVSGLLLEFERKSEILEAFVCKYYPANSKNDSLKRFFNAVMVPFKETIVEFAVHGTGEAPRVVERTVEVAPSGFDEQLEHLLVSVYDTARELPEGKIKEELLIMSEGFAAAMDARDTLLIKAIWFGLRRALQAEKLCAKECEQIDETIRLYLLS